MRLAKEKNKKFQKPLDKLKNMCYNIIKIRERNSQKLERLEL